VGRPASQTPLEHAIAGSLETGHGVLITGAGGQLGAALAEAFPNADARGHSRFDVTGPNLDYTPGLVLHAAAWTDVDGAEDHPAQAEWVNVQGTRNVVSLGAPVVYFSTDYVFDGAKRKPYVESDEPMPLSVYGRTKLEGEREVRAGWIVRTSWLFGWTGRNFVRTMLELARREAAVRVVDDQRGCPTYVGHLARATRQLLRRPHGLYHLAADGDCTWAEFADAIFAEAGIRCRVIPISGTQLGRRAARPSYSVLRSERGETPRLPHWRTGLRDCLARLGSPTIS
jgi:dTDP-4-dehydrorhamnose reductase